VNCPRKVRNTLPVGPLRWLPIMTVRDMGGLYYVASVRAPCPGAGALPWCGCPVLVRVSLRAGALRRDGPAAPSRSAGVLCQSPCRALSGTDAGL